MLLLVAGHILGLCVLVGGRTSRNDWKDQHPQQRWRLQDPDSISQFTINHEEALRLPCYSCMSPYLEDHYQYISNLYRKPLSFDVHCDRHSLDRNYLYIKNCSDMCVTLRINDVVGGRRRHGYMRGCLSDIIGYNHSLVRVLGEIKECIEPTARELFMATAQRQELDSSRLTLCGCHSPLCNSSNNLLKPLKILILLILMIFFIVS